MNNSTETDYRLEFEKRAKVRGSSVGIEIVECFQTIRRIEI